MMSDTRQRLVAGLCALAVVGVALARWGVSAADELSQRDALTLALADERQARDTYRAVIKTHGQVRPFSKVVNAEKRHIDALVRQFNALGYAVPPDEERPHAVGKTIAECCAAAAEAERANVRLYDKLLAAEGIDAGVRKTFENLREASETRHLPVFERCARRRSGAPQ